MSVLTRAWDFPLVPTAMAVYRWLLLICAYRPRPTAVSAAEANRNFSLLLRGVREGRSYVVTSHGKPVARLVPAGRADDLAHSARATLIARLENQPVNHVGAWNRDELYEDDR